MALGFRVEGSGLGLEIRALDLWGFVPSKGSSSMRAIVCLRYKQGSPYLMVWS